MQDATSTPLRMELVAPAGDHECLRAALDAGADAVYLGLTNLNARRRAANFSAAEIADAVRIAHGCSAKIYLTLNIDVVERETRAAAAALEMAARAGVDAVIVRDPLFLRLRPAFPELAWHLSTQATALNRADVEMLRDCGAQRVIVGRELSVAEIAAAAASPGVEIEVFVQGALCFAISGRCLLSSWGGGLSGNRGLCCSLCRVPWRKAASGETRWPFAMRDLCAIERLPALCAAGVKAIKIEGRLKNAAWVRQAVALYRRGLAGGDLAALRQEAEALGAYAGRQMTCAYLDGCRTGLTAPAGRPAAAAAGPQVTAASRDTKDGYRIAIATAGGEWEIMLAYRERAVTWRMRPPAIKHPGRAVALADFAAVCREQPLQGLCAREANVDDPGKLLAPRFAAHLRRLISAFLHTAIRKSEPAQAIAPRPAALALLPTAGQGGERALGNSPDRVRLRAADVERFLRTDDRRGITAIIVEGIQDAGEIERLTGDLEIVIALPLAFFEEQISCYQALVAAAAARGIAVEANTWSAVRLARAIKARWQTGPGLAVLNATAANFWGDLGASCVCVASEASRRQMQDLCRRAVPPLAITVYARPILAVARAEIEANLYDQVLVDRRGMRLRPQREGGLTILRPLEPYNWLALIDPQINVAHLDVDLSGEEDALAVWRALLQKRWGFRFNYDRELR